MGLRRRRFGRRSALAALLGASACQRPPGPLSTVEAMPPEMVAPGLRPLGVLSIDGSAFGADGLSGLHVSPDLTLTAISDRGRWGQARLLLRPDGSPLGLENARSGALRDTAGRPLTSALTGDAECLAALPDGSWLVGFERNHRIWHYPSLDGAALPIRAPPELALAPTNGGLESLGVLPDGRWLAIAEQQRPEEDETARIAWIGGPGNWRSTAYRPAPGFDPSDLCPLPDGGALVLERRFALTEGFSARITRLPPLPAVPGLLEGGEIVRLDTPLPTDNWEGIAAFRHGGRGLVAVISDDNQFVLQRTLLMVLGWADQAAS